MSALLLALIGGAAGASPGSPPVPPDPPTDAAFPVAGPLSLFQYSLTRARVGVSLGSDNGFYTLEQDLAIFDPPVYLGNWTSGANPTSDFEARVTVSVGTLNYGEAVGAWLNLGTTRNWGLEYSTVIADNATFTVEIRDATTLVVLDSIEVSVEIEVGT